MIAKVVSLTAHRNTADRRKRHEASEALVRDARKIAECKQVSGYVIVAFNEGEDKSVAFWSGRLPPSVLPEFARAALQQKIDEENS